MIFLFMKNPLVFFSLVTISTLFAQDEDKPVVKIQLLNQLTNVASFKFGDKTDVEKREKLNIFNPNLTSTLYFTLSYKNVSIHSRLKTFVDKGASYFRFDRGYINYKPIDALTLTAGMNSSMANYLDASLSGDMDDITTPLIEGALGNLTSTRDMGLWLTYKTSFGITVKPYLLAPKAIYNATNLTNTFFKSPDASSIFTSVTPNNSGKFVKEYDIDPKTNTPIYTGRTILAATELQKNLAVVPYLGASVGYLNGAFTATVNYETSILRQHELSEVINYDRPDLHFGAYLENVNHFNMYNVTGQTKTAVGVGAIGYFGPDNRFAIELAYIGSFERLDKTELKKNQSSLSNTAFVNNVVDKYVSGKTYEDKVFYDTHQIDLEARFNVFSGDQLYFIVGGGINLPGKKLSAMKDVAGDKGVKLHRTSASITLLVASKI